MIGSSRSVLPAGSVQVHYDPVLLDLCYLQDLLKSSMIGSSRSVLPAGSIQVHYDPVLLDLCYLQDLLKSTMTLFF